MNQAVAPAGLRVFDEVEVRSRSPVGVNGDVDWIRPCSRSSRLDRRMAREPSQNMVGAAR